MNNLVCLAILVALPVIPLSLMMKNYHLDQVFLQKTPIDKREFYTNKVIEGYPKTPPPV
jgi:hypothetical protein